MKQPLTRREAPVRILSPHRDYCDCCGAGVWLEIPRAINQDIVCEDCWRAQEYDPASDVF